MIEGPSHPFRVLFVCTGNVCRSATAQALLQQRIVEHGAGEMITATSAGVGAQDGWPIDPTIAGLLEKQGLPRSDAFRSRFITSAIVDAADVILTGTRDHRLRIGSQWPAAYARTFTLRETAWLLTGMPADLRERLPVEPPERAIAALAWLQQERGEVSMPETELDIEDPIGRRPRAYRRMIDQVSMAVDVVAGVLLPDGAFKDTGSAR